MIPSRKSTAIGLYSGGLDSILATRLVTEQGVSVVALRFRLPFAAPGRVPDEDRLSQTAALVGASLVSFDVGEDYLNIVKSPEFGYVMQLAPCVDCMLYMLRKARDLARELKADFIFTGEVVGQRSACQNKRSLRAIEKASGLEGRLLRPLSAKLLDPTIPELTGLVRRERLLDFRGRGRRRQIRLAHEFGVVDYPIPGGGCLLCDRNLASRCRDAMAHEQLTLAELPLLMHGRHFRLESGAKVVVGRNEAENHLLERLAVDGDVLCRPLDVMGPVVVLRSRKPTKRDIELAARICARYSDAAEEHAVKVACAGRALSLKPLSDAELDAWRVTAAPEAAPEPADGTAETKEEGAVDE